MAVIKRSKRFVKKNPIEVIDVEEKTEIQKAIERMDSIGAIFAKYFFIPGAIICFIVAGIFLFNPEMQREQLDLQDALLSGFLSMLIAFAISGEDALTKSIFKK